MSARALVVTLALLPAPALAAEADAWVGQLTPYVWGSGLDGTLTPFSGAPTVRIDKSFGELLEDLDGAFFLTGYARRDRLVLLGDLSYAASSRQGRVPPGLPAEGQLGGLRHWDVKTEVRVPLAGISRSPGDRFTDPLLAVRGNLSLAPRWSLIGYADVGGFGVGSDQTWQWLATVNYLHGERWAFSAGLRQLSVDYRDGGTRIDATLAGPLLGVSWRF